MPQDFYKDFLLIEALRVVYEIYSCNCHIRKKIESDNFPYYVIPQKRR